MTPDRPLLKQLATASRLFGGRHRDLCHSSFSALAADLTAQTSK
jgi:hypothetical protein